MNKCFVIQWWDVVPSTSVLDGWLILQISYLTARIQVTEYLYTTKCYSMEAESELIYYRGPTTSLMSWVSIVKPTFICGKIAPGERGRGGNLISLLYKIFL